MGGIALAHCLRFIGRMRPPFPTRLMRAAYAGQAWLVRALIPFSRVDARDHEGMTALRIAADMGHVECVRLLAEIGDPNDDRGWAGWKGNTALWHATNQGSAGCVAILAPLTDPNKRDHRGATPLIVAAACGYGECLRILLPWSLADAVDSRGRSALCWAALREHDECVDALLMNHADPGLAACEGSDALRAGGHHGTADFILWRMGLIEREAMGQMLSPGQDSKRNRSRL